MNRTRAGWRPGRALPALLAAGACVAACASPAGAQTPPDGRSFAGVRFTTPTVPGPVGFSGQRVHRWRDGGVQRLVLNGSVLVRLGERLFRAERAAAWIEPAPDRGGSAAQVFVFLEDVGDPAQPASGEGVVAPSLPVRGVFELGEGVTIRGDLIIDGAPGSPSRDEERKVESAGEAALARALKKQLGVPETGEAPPPLPTYTPSGRVSARWTQARANPPSTVRPKPATPRPPAPGETAVSTLPPTQPRQVSPGQGPAPGPAAPAPDTPTPPPTREAAAAPGTPPTPVTPGPATPPATPAPAGPTAAPAPGEAIFAKDGVVTIAPKNFSIVSGETESAITAWGGVTVQYEQRSTGRALDLKAQRAVIFLDPGDISRLAGMKAENIRGIYLEGDVSASDGSYTMRGPSVYYDLRQNLAVMLDAVFWTYDEQRQLPIYVRAKTIRQTAANVFEGEKAQFTNSAFFDPELAVGASKITITRREELVHGQGLDAGASPTTQRRVWVEAQDITGRVLGIPLAYWPLYSGDPENRILRDLRFENRSGSGGAVMTTLNAYALLGLKTPRDLSVDLLTDFYFERGPGLGVKADWKDERQKGSLLAYTLPIDRGWDVLKPGTKLNHDNDFRGILTGEQRWRIDPEWTAYGEVAAISDPTFVQAFFPSLGETRREFTNRLGVRRLRDNTYFAAEIKGTLQDFIANEYLLESQGYSVTRTPEGTYVRLADDLLPQTAPGMLTYFQETRAGRLELAFDEQLAREHGMYYTSLSQRAFGVNPDDRLSDVLRSRGLSEEPVYRLDTRHEVTAQLEAGPIRVNPFVVARATFWDNSFEAFSPDEDNQWRLWGGGGVRFSTTMQRIDDDADSRLLDVHRLRHIVEPSLTLWGAGSTIERKDLPVYDQDVEGVLEGAMARIGVKQTLQTQRGGPGRWHAVDLLTVNTDLVFSTDDTGSRGPYGRFLEFRPEESNPGNYFVGDMTLRATDATSFIASTVYDLDANQQAASSVGVMLRQTPEFTASVDLRFLNPQDSTYLTTGLRYDLTDKYSASWWGAYDTNVGRFQYTGVEIRRRFRSLIFGLAFTTNEITGESSVSVVLRPYGANEGFGFGTQDARVGASR